MTIKGIKSLLRQIEARKNAIAKERDKLRELYDEIGELLEPFNDGIMLLETGKRDIEDAIDTISQVV